MKLIQGVKPGSCCMALVKGFKLKSQVIKGHFKKDNRWWIVEWTRQAWNWTKRGTWGCYFNISYDSWYCKEMQFWEMARRRHLLKKYLGDKKNTKLCKWLNVEGGGEYKEGLLTLYFGPSMWFTNLLCDLRSNVVHEYKEKTWSWNIQIEMVNTHRQMSFLISGWKEGFELWVEVDTEENHLVSVKMRWTLRMKSWKMTKT